MLLCFQNIFEGAAPPSLRPPYALALCRFALPPVTYPAVLPGVVREVDFAVCIANSLLIPCIGNRRPLPFVGLFHVCFHSTTVCIVASLEYSAVQSCDTYDNPA